MNTTIKKQECSRKQRRWQAHVTQQVESGMSRAEYCRQYNLSYYALTYWCRKLLEPKELEMSLVPVTFRNDLQPHRCLIKILLPGSAAIEIGDDFNPGTLNKLLDTMEARKCCR